MRQSLFFRSALNAYRGNEVSCVREILIGCGLDCKKILKFSEPMNLLCLAPDVQEQILFLPSTVRGRDPLLLRQMQPIAQALDWQRQRALWRMLLAEEYPRLKLNEEMALGVGAGAALRTPAKTKGSGSHLSTLTTTGKDYHGQV
jgi:hypothetical protein